MCGRSACTLGSDEIVKACSTKKDGKKFSCPKWQDHPGNHIYSPSTNVAPSVFCPVMIRSDMLPGKSCKRNSDGDRKEELEFIIQPMMWGLVPPFHKGETATGHSYKTNNCRMEDIENKKMFQPSLAKRQRCVVLFDGFYEWQTTKGEKNKQPYFIHSPQLEGIQIYNRESWDKENVWSETEGWLGPRLLKLAGLFSHWTSTTGEQVFSFTVLTMESGKKFSSLHHRIPAVLQNEEEIQAWLNPNNLDNASLLKKFTNDPELVWYPVSSLVNNSRNKDDNLLQPISLEQKKKAPTAESKFMSSWLKKKE